MKTVIRFLAVLVLLSLCLTACQKKEEIPVQSTDSDEPVEDSSSTEEEWEEEESEQEEEKPIPLASADALILAKRESTDYTVVLDDAIDENTKRIVENFCTRFSNKTGAAFDFANDTVPPTDKELLIYTMDGRSETSSVFAKITAPEKNGFRIEAVGERIVVACDKEEYLKEALSLLEEAIRPCEDGSYGIEKNYLGKLDLPTPAVNVNSTVRMISSGAGNMTLVIDQAYKRLYTQFLEELAQDGFSKYSENRIGYACFTTYYKDSQFGQEAVYVMYYPDDSCYKITYGPLYELPRLEEPTVKEPATPSFAQTRRVEGMGAGNAPGMCCVVQCSDGKYIVFDGGSNNSEDKQTLYSYLAQNNPRKGRPVIAAWVITHAHGDHMGLANAFLDEYADKIKLEMVVYNFPDWDRINIQNESTDGMKALVGQFQSVVEKKYPNTKTWVAHTGEIMKFAGCTMTVLYTPEDYATGMGLESEDKVYFPWGNHTNTTYRLDINGTTVMMLGDSESTLNAWMARTYKEDLKSDILQLAHHGSNGGHIDLYRAIDPDICIWPVESTRMEQFKNTYDFNRYLLTNTKNGDVRVHHSMDDTVVYDCTENGAIRRTQWIN